MPLAAMKRISIELIIIGTALLVFGPIGATVDPDGRLHECFAPLVLGWAFVVLGVLGQIRSV